MNPRYARPLAATILLVAGTACAGGSDDASDAGKLLGKLCRMVEYYADSGFMHMAPQYAAFKRCVDQGEGETLADALLHVARENAGSTNETQKARFAFAVTWIDEFGGTNALPFLLEEMKREEFRGRNSGQIPSSRHMTVASFFRIANRKNATEALHAAAEMLADERWSWMRNELYYESTQTVLLHEASDRLKVAKAGGGVVNLRAVREPICGFLAECYENETAPERFAFLDGFIRSKLPEWKSSERRLQGAQRMLRLHPESKAVSGVIRSVQDARNAQPAGGTASVQPGDSSDTEIVEPLPAGWADFQY